MVLSGPKTLLETGESLTTPGSLRYLALMIHSIVVGSGTRLVDEVTHRLRLNLVE